MKTLGRIVSVSPLGLFFWALWPESLYVVVAMVGVVGWLWFIAKVWEPRTT